jgi:hypothetical protein
MHCVVTDESCCTQNESVHSTLGLRSQYHLEVLKFYVSVLTQHSALGVTEFAVGWCKSTCAMCGGGKEQSRE